MQGRLHLSSGMVLLPRWVLGGRIRRAHRGTPKETISLPSKQLELWCSCFQSPWLCLGPQSVVHHIPVLVCTQVALICWFPLLPSHFHRAHSHEQSTAFQYRTPHQGCHPPWDAFWKDNTVICQKPPRRWTIYTLCLSYPERSRWAVLAHSSAAVGPEWMGRTRLGSRYPEYPNK